MIGVRQKGTLVPDHVAELKGAVTYFHWGGARVYWPQTHSRTSMNDALGSVRQELLREGERQLAGQWEHRESILRRAGELVRLGIAVLGAVVVIAGFVVASGVRLGEGAHWSICIGVMLVIVSVGKFSGLIAGVAGLGVMSSGPNRRVLIAHWADEQFEADVLASLALALPDIIGENDRAIVRMSRVMALGLFAMAAGAIVLLLTCLYIVGGAIGV